MKHVRLCKIYFLKTLRFFKRKPEEFLIAIITLVVSLFFTAFELKENFKSQEKYISNFTKWHNELSLKRSIANFEEVQCLNILDTKYLKQEIKRLEANIKYGQEFNGNWQGVELNQLLPSEAKLLHDFGHLIGNKAFVQNFSSCDNVVCIFNEIYQDKDEVAGLYLYYWYLKTGSIIALSNVIPSQNSKFPGLYNDKKFSLQDYLFSKEDLQEFVQIAYALPEYLTYNPLLRSFIKIPDDKFERTDINTCISIMRSGNVLINEKCLRAEGNFKRKIIEAIISYHDLYLGENYKSSSVSTSSRFLKLGLWEEEPFLKEDLSWTHKWISHVNQEHSSPQDFYQTLVRDYVYDLYSFKQKSSIEITRFIESDLFRGIGFDALTFSENILKESINNWNKKEISLWHECLTEHDGKFSLCYDEKDISSFIHEETKKIAHTAQGCQFLKDTHYEIGKKRYEKELRKYIQEKHIQHKFEIEFFKEKTLNYQNALLTFKKDIDPIFALIHCDQKKELKDCYEKFLSEKASAILNANHIQSKLLIDKGIKDMIALYPYELAIKNSKKMIEKFLSPYLMKSYFAAKEIVSSCKKLALRPHEKLHFPLIFSGGMRYIEATTLNCINDSLLEKIEDIAASEKRISLTRSEKKFVASKIKHYFTNSLEAILEREETNETQKLALRFENIQEEFLSRLKKADTLIKESYSQDELEKKCLHEVSLQANQKIFYHSKNEIEEKFGKTICGVYLNDPMIKEKLQVEVQKKWQESLKWANETFQSVFSLETEKCQSRYPATSDAKFKNQRLKTICEKEAHQYAKQYTKSLWERRPEAKVFEDKMSEVKF